MTIPVTLIAGFLGSGKTTLVRRVLSEPHGLRCAVVVNEFGALGIDGELVVRGSAESSSVVELANGCICCEVQEDLRTTLRELAGRSERASRPRSRTLTRWLRRAAPAMGASKGPIDHILVEASGAASPGPAVQTFLVDGDLAQQVHLNSVVTVCHVEHIERLVETTVEAPDQIAYADRIVVGHADRVPPGDVERISAWLRTLNPLADIRAAAHGALPVRSWVLAPLDAGRVRQALPAGVAGRHTPGLRSIALEADGAVDLDALLLWLEFLARRRGQELMRAKGIVAARGGASIVEIQGVYRWLEAAERAPGHGDHLEEADGVERSRLVLIGRDLDEAEVRRGWAAVCAGMGA